MKRFRPYYNDRICEQIDTIAEEIIYQHVVAMNIDQVFSAIDDYNTKVKLDRTFSSRHESVVLKKSLIYHQNELRRSVAAGEIVVDDGRGCNPFMSVLGFLGSIAVGAFVGDLAAKALDLDYDKEEIDRLLGK